MKEKKLRPKRRFKEFENDGDWGQRKLGEVANYRNGKAHENDISDHGKYIVVNSKFVSTDGEVRKYSEQQIEPLYKDEITFVLSDVPNGRAIARTFLIDEDNKYTLNQRIAGITPYEDVTPYFLYVLMNRNRYFLQFDDGAKQTNLSLNDVMEFEEAYPCFEEQQKIGTLFKNLDNLITLHQCKLKKLKETKSAYLSEMFPKEGEKYPKRRFDGFTNPWEERKLFEVAEFNPKSELPDKFEYVDLESVVGTEMISHRTETKHSAPSRAQRLAKNGDIFYQTVRPYQKNNYLFTKSDNNYVFSTGYAQMRPNIDTTFLMSLLQTEAFVKVVLDNCTGTSYPAINSTDLSNLEISLPISRDEQRKIGGMFSNLDNLITLNQRKLEKLENLKKAYLNEMFV